MTLINSYQQTNCTNINNFNDALSCINQSGANFTFTAIDFLVFMVIFITLTGAFGWESAILSAGFIGIILSILFSYAGLISWSITGMFVGIILVIIMYVIWNNRYD